MLFAFSVFYFFFFVSFVLHFSSLFFHFEWVRGRVHIFSMSVVRFPYNFTQNIALRSRFINNLILFRTFFSFFLHVIVWIYLYYLKLNKPCIMNGTRLIICIFHCFTLTFNNKRYKKLLMQLKKIILSLFDGVTKVI